MAVSGGWVVQVVDDDPTLREVLVRALECAGYEAQGFADGRSMLAAMADGEPDLVILDVNLPGLDGYEICRRVRTISPGVPVLMLSARGTVPDRVAGLDVGADDYLTKPFDLDELLARARALLRRRSPPPAGRAPVVEWIVAGDLAIDTLGRVVLRRGRAIALTRVEYDLLLALVVAADVVVTKEDLYARIWNIEFETNSRSLDVHVSNLRAKTERHGEPRLVHTERGVGYVFRPIEPVESAADGATAP